MDETDKKIEKIHQKILFDIDQARGAGLGIAEMEDWKDQLWLINQLKKCREECKARQDLATAYRTGSNKLATKALDALEKLNL